MKFTLRRKSENEKKIQEWHEKRSNIENPPIIQDVELIANHTIWRGGKNRGTYGQGPLFELTTTEAKHFIDSAKEASKKVGGFPGINPESIEDPEEGIEESKKVENLADPPETTGKNPEDPGKNFDDDGLTVYRVGQAYPFVAPKFMGISFVLSGKWQNTIKGIKKTRNTGIAMIVLSYLFLIYYLPQRDSVSDWTLIFSRFAIALYCISGVTVYWHWVYSKRATASRIRMQCFNPDLCDLAGMHVGTMVCPKYPPSVQLRWWFGKNLDILVSGLSNALSEKIADYRKEITSMKGRLKAKDIFSRVEAHDYFSRMGFLYKDDPEVKGSKRLALYLIITTSVLFILVIIFGAIILGMVAGG